jgi:probable HAF family extracellular repeat protein
LQYARRTLNVLKAIAMKKLTQWLIVAFGLISVLSTGLEAAPRYFFEDLGNLGKPTCTPLAINGRGQVVGWSYDGLGVGRAFLKTPGQPMQNLGFLGDGSGESFATAMNDAGQIVGYAYLDNESGISRAFLINPGKSMQDLGDLGGNKSAAAAINATGQIVGYAETSTAGVFHAFLKDPGEPMQDLGTLGEVCTPQAINSSGQIVGTAIISLDNNIFQAFRLNSAGAFQELGALGGVSSVANAINDNGQIVGGAETADGLYHAFLLNPGGSMQDLETLGGNASTANAINGAGQIVGTSAISLESEAWDAFIKNPGEPMQDVNRLVVNLPPGFVLMEARAINNSGMIAGTYWNGVDDYLRGFLLTTKANRGNTAAINLLLLAR